MTMSTPRTTALQDSCFLKSYSFDKGARIFRTPCFRRSLRRGAPKKPAAPVTRIVFLVKSTDRVIIRKLYTMQNNQSVLYVNFAQYDNAGRILDYLVTNFTIVAHFSFDHLRLKSGRKTNFLKVYNHGKLIEEVTLRNIRLKPLLQFPTLPIVAFMMVYQTLFHAWRLSRHFGPFSYFFTVNAFSALIGISTKLLGFSQKTVYWVWDFFPLTFPDWRIRLIRKIYWQWDKLALRFSDHVVFTNKRLQTMILKTRHVGHSQKYSIVPVGTRVYA